MKQIIAAAVILTIPSCVAAYEAASHREMAERAIQLSTVDQVLQNRLQLPRGIREVFDSSEVISLVGNGAQFEDSPVLRSLNHFHNPLRPWAQAGLQLETPLFGVQLGESSLLWQQNPAQDARAGGGDWSWQVARDAYFHALTASAKSARDRAFADTFRALGHLTHLVQDATVPAHTRNDPHLLHEGYEAWVDAMRRGEPGPRGENGRGLFDGLLGLPPVRPSTTIFTPTNDAGAPVPIARLIDTDRFDGLDPAALIGADQGAAEYSNGNFVSEDTIFRDFALPRPEALGPGFLDAERRGQRLFFSKQGDGESVPHFVAEGGWFQKLMSRAPELTNVVLSDRVYQDYAGLLIPRAVGYSAALLDYFFRGRLDTFGTSDDVAAFNPGDEPMEGKFTLFYDDVDGVRHEVAGASWDLAIAPRRFSESQAFTAPVAPTPKQTGRYLLVFQGTLGGEARAVTGQEVTIPERLTVRLLKRRDETPLTFTGVETIDAVSGRRLGLTTTNTVGEARIAWVPGATRLRIPTGLVFIPQRKSAFWAGPDRFVSKADDARLITPADLDANQRLTVKIPLIFANEVRRLDPCTGLEIPAGNVLERVPAASGGFEFIGTNSAHIDFLAFTRADTGQRQVFIENGVARGVLFPNDFVVVEDWNRIGSIIGTVERTFRETYVRQTGDPRQPPICLIDYDETEFRPVMIFEAP